MAYEVNNLIKINLHNHTTWSDGTLLPVALVGAGIDSGVDVIAITDHFLADKVGSCVNFSNLEKYIEEVKSLNDYYKEKSMNDSCVPIIIPGLEIDLKSGILAQTDESYHLLERLSEFPIKYFLFEGISSIKDVETVIKFKNKFSNSLVGFAHWNIREVFSIETFFDLIDEFINNKLFIEITTGIKSFIRESKDKVTHYYNGNIDYYKEYCERGGMISLGTDTHFRVSDLEDWSKGYKFLDDNDLTPSLKCFLEYMKLKLNI